MLPIFHSDVMTTFGSHTKEIKEWYVTLDIVNGISITSSLFLMFPKKRIFDNSISN